MNNATGDVVAAPALGAAAAAGARRQVTTREVTSGFGWLALGQYSNRLLGFVSTLILAKVLAPADFGLVAIASMMIEIIQILRDMGLSEAVIYNKREDRAALDTAHTVLVGYNVFLFVLAAAASPFVAGFYGNQTLIPIIILMSSNLVLNSLRLVPLTLVRKNLEYKKLVLPDLLPTTVSSIVGIVLALLGFGVWSLVIKTMVQSVLALIVIQAIIPFRPKFAFDRAAATELFHYGKFIVGSSILFVSLYNVDRLFVSKIAGIAAFGAFDLAARIAEMPAKQFSGLVGAVMFPVFSTMDKSRAALGAMFLRTLKYTASITFPAAVGLSAFGPALVDLLYGPKWAGLGTLLRLMAIYAALRSISSIVHDLFKATGKPQLMQRATIFKLASILTLGAPAVHAFGAWGVAALLVVTYIVVMGWELAQVAAVLELPLGAVTGVLVKPIGLALIVIPTFYGLARLTMPDPNALLLLAEIAVCGGAYLASLYLLDNEVGRDVRKIWASFRKPTVVTS